MNLHANQDEIARCQKKNKVIRAGRKGGKTLYEVENISFKATTSAKRLNVSKKFFPSGRKVLYIAPTQDQARSIIWQPLKNKLGKIGKFNEQMLQVVVPNEDNEKSTIYLGSWEKRETYRGFSDVVHITFDETDTFKNFFIDWLDIFVPMFLDTGGSTDFIGTPKKENPNLRRLEKLAETDNDFACFHFTSKDNPFLDITELKKLEERYKDNYESYRQEILAEYLDNLGALFRYDSLIDVFSNTITKNNEKYLIVDIADDGSDKTIFSFWEDLEEYRREEFSRMNTETIVNQIREYASQDRIPYSHIAVDAIGVGAGVASSSMLDGVVGYKSSYQAIKTEPSIVALPNVSYIREPPMVSDFKNLRSQCVFKLAELVNNHQIASRCAGRQKEVIIEELQHYQDVSQGDGKRMATQKEDIKEIIGHSPDASDCFIMRCFFEIMRKVLPAQSEEMSKVILEQKNQFALNKANYELNSSK